MAAVHAFRVHFFIEEIPVNAAEKWAGNLPMNLKELAEVQAVSYATVVRWAQDLDFPRVRNFIKRADFEAWWKKAARRRKAEHRPRSGAGKSGALPAKSDSQAAWPPQAARLLGESLSHN